MTNAPTQAVTADVTAVEKKGKVTLLTLLASGSLWLVVSGILSLVASIQVHTPGFCADCPFLTYGHTTALAETAFIYGWIANAGLALALWILGRLGGEPLRGLRFALFGAVFWNLGVTVAEVGIASGHQTGFPLFQIPGYVDLILFVAYGCIAIPGILAWTGRRRSMTFVSQWYAVAALYLFPWLLTLAHIFLIRVPVKGTLQAVVAAWFAQCAISLWLAPLGLAVAYYLVPRIKSRVIPAYEFALIGFWTLIVIGAFCGGRRLIGGPVPAWIPTIGIVSAALIFFHYMIVFLNLRPALASGGSVSLRLVGVGLVLYVLGALGESVTSIRGIAEITQFTYVDTAHTVLALYGGVTLFLVAGAYFALPALGIQIKGASVHATLLILGVVLLSVSLAAAGWAQGKDLLDPAVTFAKIGEDTHAWLLTATAAQGLLLLGNLFFALNLLKAILAALNEQAQAALAGSVATSGAST